jgi:hypothetical protein
MPTTHRALSLHDVAVPEAPRSVRLSTALWLTAVGAGIAESVLGATEAATSGSVGWPALAAQIAFRTIVYGGLLVVIAKYFRHGRNWSRIALTGLLGVVGLATLVEGPIGWLAGDGKFSELDLDAGFVAFAVIRSVHILSIIAGLVLMYRPDANRWFRPARHA